MGRACSREAHWLKCCLMWTIVSASDRVVGWGGVACRVLFFIFIMVTFYLFFILFILCYLHLLRGCNIFNSIHVPQA